MSSQKASSAEHADNHRRLLFLTMMFVSLIFATKAGSYLINDSMKYYLEFAGTSFLVLSALFIIITVYWKWRFIPRSERYHLLTSSDSYVNLIMYKAIKTSWILTMLMLIFFTIIKSKVNSALPAEFYFNLALFIMLAVFSGSFFILFSTGVNEQHQHTGQ